MARNNPRLYLELKTGSVPAQQFRKAVNTPLDEQATFFKKEIRHFLSETNVPSGHKKTTADHSITAKFSVRNVGETASVVIRAAYLERDLKEIMDAHTAFVAPMQTVPKPPTPAKEAGALGAP